MPNKKPSAKNPSAATKAAENKPSNTAPIPAGLLRRLAAMFYDAILSLALAFGITAAGILLRIATQGEELVREQGVALQDEQAIYLQLSIAAVLFLFFGGFWTKTGQTLGMQAWRLRIDNDEGERINWRQAFIRYIGGAVSGACLGLGYLWLIMDKDQRTWHDKWSHSQVMLLPRQSKNKTGKTP